MANEKVKLFIIIICYFLTKLHFCLLAKVSKSWISNHCLILCCISYLNVSQAAEIAITVNEGMEIQQRNSFDVLLNILREPCLYLVPNETDLVKFIPPDSTFISKFDLHIFIFTGICLDGLLLPYKNLTLLTGHAWQNFVANSMSIKFRS